MIDDLIPTFNKGDFVIYKPKPIEKLCPKCGLQMDIENVLLNCTILARIIGKCDGELSICKCGYVDTIPVGFYAIEMLGIIEHNPLFKAETEFAYFAPYTHLSKPEIVRLT